MKLLVACVIIIAMGWSARWVWRYNRQHGYSTTNCGLKAALTAFGVLVGCSAFVGVVATANAPKMQMAQTPEPQRASSPPQASSWPAVPDSVSGAAVAAEVPSPDAMYLKALSFCKPIKNYTAWRDEVAGNYDTKLQQYVSGYLPGKIQGGDNAPYLFVNPKKWEEMSPKDQIELTNAAYMVEVCHPKSTEWPTLLIANWKTKRIIGTRKAWEIGGWFGS